MGIALGLGVLLGVRAASVGAVWLGAAPAALLLVLATLLRAPARSILIFAAGGCLIGTGAGFLRTQEDPPPIVALPRWIVADVVSDPVMMQTGVRAEIAWADSGVRRRTVAWLPAAPPVGRGDRIELAGSLLDGAGHQMWATKVRVIERAGRLERRRGAIRTYLADSVLSSAPGAPGSLTVGLLIGDDSGLSREDRADLRAAGLSHITAVSGWNVTLVTATIGSIFLALRLRGWFWSLIQLMALAGYVWLIGPAPPVLRAAIMGASALAAAQAGRPSHSLTAVVLSAAVMVAVSPASLTSLSFRLSALATTGLIASISMTRGMDGWRRVVVMPAITTTIAGLVTAPLVAQSFGIISLAAIPANLLAAPLVPAATVGGIVVVAASPLAPIAALAGWSTWVTSGVILFLARVFASIPFGHTTNLYLSAMTTAVIYTALIYVALLVLPEGRLIGRRLTGWWNADPAATVTAGVTLVTLISIAVILV